MKKFFLTSFVFAASAVYVVYQYIGGSPVSAFTPTVADSPQQHIQVLTPPQATPLTQLPPPVPSAPVQPPVQTPPPAPAPKPKGQYNDGVYTGSPADAYYGMVQVQATIQGGRLTAVDFLQYPNDRRTSQYINSQAMPMLKQEALQAQSADVSGVSGASDTSPAFIQSLGDALAQAKN